MDVIKRRRRRRASLGLTVRLQTLVTEDMADSIRKLADETEVSEGAVIRDALEIYDPSRRLATAQDTNRRRRQREAAKGREVAV